ncbi:MAG: EF-P lysine aminoacylase GenX [Francisellaceae bacterium]|jgi:elongation factor P--(R)-beta-lysine ligase|nr:EF-P lysine aminoacylase GenX [Francisellaceae bacterium]MBT6208331.1 EF-P lysine aminoacylase GenX [Francisellaceae bacterium]MBT6539383.1 EF-P lysine aminoacylase GenX [Francisellaceae bacterium]
MYKLPTNTKIEVITRAQLYSYIRNFFIRREVLEVQTPILSNFVATSPHIKPIATSGSKITRYLHTSPEFAMKKMLANDLGSIYQICSAFRDDESGPIHSNEFTMLEWYRVNFTYKDLIQEAIELLSEYLDIHEVERVTYLELFRRYLHINPHVSTIMELKSKINDDFVSSEPLSRDDYLSICFNRYIEPNLTGKKIWVVYDYPESQAEYANIKKLSNECNVAMRFEVYIDGIELANGYDELTCPKEQKRRMESELLQSKRDIPLDQELISALRHGIPKCSGIALGIDRLLMLKCQLSP